MSPQPRLEFATSVASDSLNEELLTTANEIWKTIPSFPRYEASNLGRIRRCVSGRSTYIGKILDPDKNRSGYLQVSLHDGSGKKYTRSVHRLVLEAHVGPSLLPTNHKSGVKTDNRLENLEYRTYSDNLLHAFALGLRESTAGEKHPQAKLDWPKVGQIFFLSRFCGFSQRFVARYFGVALGTVEAVLSGKIWARV